MRRSHVFWALVLLLSGCAKVAEYQGKTEPVAPASGKGQMLPGSQIKGSGFLRDYSLLKPIEGQPNRWQWVKPGVDWRPYTKIMLQPMEVWVNPTADYPAIQPQLYRQVENTIRDIVSREFEAGGYRMVTSLGPDVLVFHYAITGVTPVRQGLVPTDVLPVKAAITAVRYASGTEAYYVALSLELEALDGATGERVYETVGARRGYSTKIKGEEITWEDLRDSTSYVARDWRTRLDRARGVEK